MPNSSSDQSQTSSYIASIIISVYKDVDNLAAILNALEKQSIKERFEVIVSEDGNDPEIRNFISNYSSDSFSLLHLTQEDLGFRKNRALNRAVANASSDRLMFLDGDCVPHTKLIESHLKYLKKGVIGIGRRVELGPRLSRLLKNSNKLILKLSSPAYYLAYMLPALFDRAHHYESGFRYEWLHNMTRDKGISLLGCNFSCHKADLISVNGFNENYQSPGYGEDTDLEFRLSKLAIKKINLKFYAQVFHLYHTKSYAVTQQNKDLYQQTKQKNSVKCEPGIDQYLAQKNLSSAEIHKLSYRQ